MKSLLKALVLTSVLLPTLSTAGPNEGAVLILHADESLVYTDTAETYCGQSPLTECAAADTRVDGSGTDVVVYVLAAFPSNASPRLSGALFGVDYDPAALYLTDWGNCGDFFLPGTDWPNPGATGAVTWETAQLGLVTEVFWFAAYAYGPATELSLIVGGCGGGVADDDIPANLDEVVDYGRLGFNMDGYLPCPVAQPTIDDFELIPSTVAVYQPCGGSFDVDLNIVEVESIGSFELCVGYDDALISVAAKIDSTLLGSTGNIVVPLSPGACASSCQSAGLRVGVEMVGSQPPASGSGRLAELTLTPVGGGAGTSSICLEFPASSANTDRLCRLASLGIGGTDAEYAVPSGPATARAVPGLEILSSPYCYGDFNGTGDVTALDLIQIIPKWRCCETSGCYSSVFDVNLLERGNYCASAGDGCVDIVDIQSVAGRWHLGCGDELRLAGDVSRSGASPTVRVSPAVSTWNGDEGDIVGTLEVVVDDVVSLGAFQASLSFDPAVLQVESVSTGDFLGSTGRVVYAVAPIIDNAAGLVHFGASTVNELPGASGTGVLAEIVFRVASCPGNSDFTLSDAILTDLDGWPHPLGATAGGSVEVGCAPLSSPTATGPTELALFQSRPNPLTRSTVIPFAIPATIGNSVATRIEVYAPTGRLVRVLLDTTMSPGVHRVEWDGRDGSGRLVPSGAYFCRLSHAGKELEKRILVAR